MVLTPIDFVLSIFCFPILNYYCTEQVLFRPSEVWCGSLKMDGSLLLGWESIGGMGM